MLGMLELSRLDKLDLLSILYIAKYILKIESLIK